MAQMNEAGIPMQQYGFDRSSMEFWVIINAQYMEMMKLLLETEQLRRRRRPRIGIPHIFIVGLLVVAILGIVAGSMYAVTVAPLAFGLGDGIASVGQGTGDAIGSIEHISQGTGDAIGSIEYVSEGVGEAIESVEHINEGIGEAIEDAELPDILSPKITLFDDKKGSPAKPQAEAAETDPPKRSWFSLPRFPVIRLPWKGDD